ncbi:Imm21 family immunity protein [Streptomyces sp. NBC_01481]|uniref:Imm21 family immunity protein n=1 Tax=Streptomyces sp. NBC_01481 TaxID=2975869 RepID=UPI00225384A2|nr:Imm21 family immunity protein [Streptomyces sp. NBC_01481]MCX4586308.1 immunity 21 family protein [Streptomyces sp. NBC_01481]
MRDGAVRHGCDRCGRLRQGLCGGRSGRCHRRWLERCSGVGVGGGAATSCYLREHRAFLHWLAADSAAGLKAAAEAVLTDPATRWEECRTFG